MNARHPKIEKLLRTIEHKPVLRTDSNFIPSFTLISRLQPFGYERREINCRTEESSWQFGPRPAADAEGNVYVVTDNGSWDGVRNFSESFLKFTSQLKLLERFTPMNHFALDKVGNDLNWSWAT
jgi:hypothetical protein